MKQNYVLWNTMHQILDINVLEHIYFPKYNLYKNDYLDTSFHTVS
ncbi:MAG: Fe-Mn family superoxide dismutase [Flavobacteriales bacterium]